MTPIEHALERTVQIIVRVCEWLTVVVGGWVAISLMLGVIFRYAFNYSLTWGDELATNLLVLMMMTVCPIGFDRHIHIAVEALVQYAPRLLRIVIALFANFVSILFFAVIVYYGIPVAMSDFTTSLASIPISRGWFTALLPILGVPTILVCVNNVFRILRAGDMLKPDERYGV
ncbi:MAG: TRAP transporter small permease [Rhodospirillales bacterium]|nr:TRAP transporter small permease [Rhodospirillales bacterium]